MNFDLARPTQDDFAAAVRAAVDAAESLTPAERAFMRLSLFRAGPAALDPQPCTECTGEAGR